MNHDDALRVRSRYEYLFIALVQAQEHLILPGKTKLHRLSPRSAFMPKSWNILKPTSFFNAFLLVKSA